MRLLFAKNAGTLHGSPSLSENQSEKLYPQDILFFSWAKRMVVLVVLHEISI